MMIAKSSSWLLRVNAGSQCCDVKLLGEIALFEAGLRHPIVWYRDHLRMFGCLIDVLPFLQTNKTHTHTHFRGKS